MHVTYQVYIFINIINLSIQIYPYKTELDLPRVRLNTHLNNRWARLMLFISVPFRPFRPFFSFFDRLNGQPFNFHLPPKQNSLSPFIDYWPFKRPFNPFRRTLLHVEGQEEQEGSASYDRLRISHRSWPRGQAALAGPTWPLQQAHG